MKKAYTAAVAVLLAAAMTACAAPATKTDNSLLGRGLGLIQKVDTLAESTDYVALFSMDEEISAIVAGIGAQDYQTPKAVYVLHDIDKAMLNVMASEGVTLSEEVQGMMQSKFLNAFSSQINGFNGTTTLAASSILAHSDSFLSGELKEPATYLYTYENGYSFMVTFVPNDETIVDATASVVINEELAKCATADEVRDFLKNTMGFETASVSMAAEKAQ